jgi:hypothetical protein
MAKSVGVLEIIRSVEKVILSEARFAPMPTLPKRLIFCASRWLDRPSIEQAIELETEPRL